MSVKSDPPTPPNPIATAGAQTSSNVSTAIANAFLNNTNQVTPTGSVSYDPSSSYTFSDPATGQSYTIPRFTATQSLSPQEQDILGQSEQAKSNLAGLAADQSANISGLLSNPINLSQAPSPGDISGLSNLPPGITSFADTGNPLSSFADAGNPLSALADAGSQTGAFADTGSQAGTFADAGSQAGAFADTGQQQRSFDAAGNVTGTFGPADNFSADRGRVEEALFNRLNPQLDRSHSQLQQQLADQGIRYGSPAYTAAMDDWNRQANDLRLNVTAQSGAEQQRLFQMAQGRAQFENQAQQQLYNEALGRGQFANTAEAQAFQEAQQRGQFGNAAQIAAYQQAQGRGQFANAAQLAAYQEAQGRGQFANTAQQAAYQQALGRGQFTNAAQQAAYEQAQGRGAFANQAQQNAYAQALGRANFFNAGDMIRAQQQQAILNAENARRSNYLQEQYASRQEPINEITALLSGGQVSRPNFLSTPQTTIPTTDIAGLINQNFAQQFSNFQAQNQQNQQLLGGALGLGGNIALASALSDRRAKENIRPMGSVLALNDDDERTKLPIYQYSYKADPASVAHIGPMAQDVEKVDPRAVGKTRDGLKTINPRRVMGSILRAA